MMGKRTMKTVLLVLTVLLLVSGTTFALMLRRTESLNNTFVPATVTCAVQEEFNGTDKSEIYVRNTGNIDAYLRLRLVTYWVDSKGNILSEPSKALAVSINEDGGWVEGSDNTYYYAMPVPPGGLTSNLLLADLTLEKRGDYLQVVEVFADAIQSQPTDAVRSSWGVTLGESDAITDVP